MTLFGDSLKGRKASNSEALKAFGSSIEIGTAGTIMYEIHSGSGPDIFTIGYEKRDIDGLISSLLDAGVDTLVDVRERAFSRRPDFRKGRLSQACEDAGIGYEHMPKLGSTAELRNELNETGDFKLFRKQFKALARKSMQGAIEDLAELSSNHTVALICYEREHCECHRSILADILASKFDATVTAIA